MTEIKIVRNGLLPPNIFNVGLKEGCDGDSFCFDRNKK